jgi:cell division protein FtsA
MVQPAVLLGLDLGASKVVAVVAVQEESGALNVTGASLANPEGGIRQGEITDINLTVNAVTRAV